MSKLHSDDLKAILDITHKINTLTDSRSILEDIAFHAGKLLEAEGASILLVNPITENLSFEVAFGENAEALYDLVVPRGKGIAGKVAQDGNAIIVNDTTTDLNFYSGVDDKTKMITKSLLAVPLTHNKEIIGVLEVINSNKPEKFTQSDVEIISIFADQAATAISNALLYKKLHTKAEELHHLFEISTLTNSVYDRKELFQKIIHLVATAYDSTRVSIMLINEEKGTFSIESACGISQSVIDSTEIDIHEDRISCQVFNSGRVHYGMNIEKTGLGRNKKFRYSKPSFISLPIKSKNIPIGVMNISEPSENVRYSGHIIPTLQTIANQIGSAYESNKRYKQRIEHEKLSKELDIMRMLQNALLISDFKNYNHLSVFARMKPAEIVGGDFYDIFELSTNRLAFCIGDVSGKGLPASLFMAVSRSVIKAYAYQFQDPSEILQKANEILVKDSHVGMFVTLFYGIVDSSANKLYFSNAGHNQQYLFRPSENQFTPLRAPGIPLGVKSDQDYLSAEIDLQPNDIIVAFTDGITEAIDTSGEEFDIDRIQDVIRDYSVTNAPTIVNSIIREVDKWAGDSPQWDDMTVITLKIGN